jgi:hypothetical protein
MIREALNTQPRVFARYEFGREKVEELGGKSRFPKKRSTRATDDGAGRKRKHRIQHLTIGTGLDDKAIEDKISSLVKQSAQ